MAILVAALFNLILLLRVHSAYTHTHAFELERIIERNLKQIDLKSPNISCVVCAALHAIENACFVKARHFRLLRFKQKIEHGKMNSTAHYTKMHRLLAPSSDYAGPPIVKQPKFSTFPTISCVILKVQRTVSHQNPKPLNFGCCRMIILLLTHTHTAYIAMGNNMHGSVCWAPLIKCYDVLYFPFKVSFYFDGLIAVASRCFRWALLQKNALANTDTGKLNPLFLIYHIGCMLIVCSFERPLARSLVRWLVGAANFSFPCILNVVTSNPIITIIIHNESKNISASYLLTAFVYSISMLKH